MGTDLVEWRARIGVFNNRRSCTKSIRSISSNVHLNCLVLPCFLLIVTHLLISIGVLCCIVLYPRVVFGILCMSCVILTEWVLASLVIAIIMATSSVYKLRSSPSCLLCVGSVCILTRVLTPGLPNLLISISNPCLVKQLLLLCGDIHVNPGPAGLTNRLNIIYANVNSLMAEEGQRFDELSLRLKSEDIHIACLSETGCKLSSAVININGYHDITPSLYKQSNRGLLVYIVYKRIINI
jgi:hypothetical protein